MITIYSTDAEGRLYTDPKRRAYVDAELLQEKAAGLKMAALLNQVALLLGYKSFNSLRTFTRCCGVPEETLQSWILSGTIAENIRRL